MRKKHFYSHLIPLEIIIIELDKLKLSKDEKTHLLTIVSSNIHFTILDVVLSHLTTTDKKTFLEHVEQDNHEKTWGFLNTKTQNLEEKIKKSAQELLDEFVKDISEVKTIKNRA